MGLKFLILSLLLSYSTISQDEWRLACYDYRSGEIWSFRTTDLVHDQLYPNSTVKAWLRLKIDPKRLAEYRIKTIQQRRRSKESTIGFNKFSYMLYRMEYNFESGENKILAIYAYKEDGDLLESTTDETEWREIIPNTIGERIYRNIKLYLSSKDSISINKF